VWEVVIDFLVHTRLIGRVVLGVLIVLCNWTETVVSPNKYTDLDLYEKVHVRHCQVLYNLEVEELRKTSWHECQPPPLRIVESQSKHTRETPNRNGSVITNAKRVNSWS
jgi:hypothetical protein